MKPIEDGIVRCKPEGILVLWISKEKARKAYSRSVILCDSCNVEIDWPVFPVIDIPPDVDFLGPDYTPQGGRALCKACAKKLYGLTQKMMSARLTVYGMFMISLYQSINVKVNLNM